ncbi:hypothetical protein [Enterococcus asini]|uniref:hypothetical protein n=1 Tax=Enterococcus asini TaxID=57732 RepID=UPI00266C9218|nr:hypothetical protein [Enterococcus asini]
MKINQRFIVKLALGFVAIGGLLFLAGFAMSGFSWDAYATEHQAWYRTFNVSSPHHEFGMMFGDDTSEEEAAEEAAERAEESRELAAERAEESAEATSDLEETLAELRSEAQDLQGVDDQKVADIEALIRELEKTLAD